MSYTQISSSPWAVVSQDSQSGTISKHNHPSFKMEPLIIQHLSLVSSHLPKILSIQGNQFIMEEAGVCLKKNNFNQFNFELVLESIEIYAHLQKKSITDEKLKKLLPEKTLTGFLQKFQTLKTEIVDILTTKTTPDKAQYSYEFFEQWLIGNIQGIENTYIPLTLSHDDLHDNNILIKNQHITLIDWAEISYAHPFLSFSFYLWRFKNHYEELFTNLQMKHFVQKMKETYLAFWINYGEYKILEETFRKIEEISLFYVTLNYHELLLLCDCKNEKYTFGFNQKIIQLFSDLQLI